MDYEHLLRSYHEFPKVAMSNVIVAKWRADGLGNNRELDIFKEYHKIKVDNKVEYKANNKHPLFEVMQKVVFKHLGLEDVVETVLERMGDVDQIILVGDYAKGNDSGLIEVFLIGQGLNMEYITQLEDKIEDLIGRKVSFYLASKFLADREHIVLFNSKEK